MSDDDETITGDEAKPQMAKHVVVNTADAALTVDGVRFPWLVLDDVSVEVGSLPVLRIGVIAEKIEVV